jgi:tRNA 2-selenouridine synthase
MFKVIKYEDIDNNKVEGNYILIDVRSPSEFKTEHIPGSINIPIFNDEERHLVGETYIQNSPELAKKMGIEFASKKLPDIYEQVSKLDKEYDKLIFFCARGGFRSSSMVSLFMTIGVNSFKLDKGYKGYRKYINENLPEVIKDVKFVVLYGNTGAGKTDILKSLKESGSNILDLEGCANHRGSILGGVGLGDQSTQKSFESQIYKTLKERTSNLVFVEGESKKIGKVVIPQYIYESMSRGINLCIDTDLQLRIDNILRDYVHGTDEELIHALKYLSQQLGHSIIDKYIEMIKNDQYREVIGDLMINYYDPHYEYKNREYIKTFKNIKSSITAMNIVEWIDDNKNT